MEKRQVPNKYRNQRFKMENQKYIPILDAGHGGIVDGKYTTAPNFKTTSKKTWKKAFYHPKDENGKAIKFFEGVFNRQVRKYLMKMLDEAGIKYFLVADTNKDMPLQERVAAANVLDIENHGKCYLVSIHGNAGGGTGFEVFTSPGETKSDKMATLMCKEIMRVFPEIAFRADHSDGDPDKEAAFYVLKKTRCPAMLTENGFFDRKQDVKKMITPSFQKKVAKAHFNAILRIEREL